MKVNKQQHQEIYRLYTVEKKTLKEIAVPLGLSIGRVSQIIKEVRKELENQSN
jgi:DNA-directed RNA polymerase specialized sigma subunit